MTNRPDVISLMAKARIVRPEYRCDDCEPDGPLYVSPRNDGYNVQIVHACEHLIRTWYRNAPEHLEPAPPAVSAPGAVDVCVIVQGETE